MFFLDSKVCKFKMKKVVITGGCGFIGSYLVKNCLSRNYKVLNIDILSYAGSNKIITDKNYQFKKVDIRNKTKINDILKKFKPDFIINCAAETHVDRSIDMPLKFFDTNLFGTLNLLQSVLKNNLKTKFIQISTDEVFGSIKKGKFNENTNYMPKSPYSASKASADHLVRSFGNTYKINYVITNCSNNYGPGQYPEKLIPLTILNCIRKKNINVYGSGKNIRDWIYVNDHAKAVIDCMSKAKRNKTYLIGASQEKTNIDIVKQICDYFQKNENNKFNYKSLIKFVKDRKGHDFKYFSRGLKIKKIINLKTTNLNQGIKKTVLWYMKKNNLKLFKKNK